MGAWLRLRVQDPWRIPGDLAAPVPVSAAGRDDAPPEEQINRLTAVCLYRLTAVCWLADGRSDLLQELDSLPLLLLPQPLPPLSLLEALTERVVVVEVHLQEVEKEAESVLCRVTVK